MTRSRDGERCRRSELPLVTNLGGPPAARSPTFAVITLLRPRGRIMKIEIKKLSAKLEKRKEDLKGLSHGTTETIQEP